MWRLGVLAFTLCLGLGCAGEGGKSQWDDFWKDLRGDNMQMHDWGMEDHPAPTKSDD